MELGYKKNKTIYKEGDKVRVLDRQPLPNWDGWGRELPYDSSRKERVQEDWMDGVVTLAVWENGSRAELRFTKNGSGWERSLDSFAEIQRL